jgi:type I restriction-modification system DNA methylase subunit
LDWLRALYERERDQLETYSESQLRDHWFNPILRQLGHTFEREARVKAQATAGSQALVNEVLSLKVLDPAMGSGHFLVEVTDYLARALVTDH